MEYTYKGKDYPKELSLNHKEVLATLSKDPLDITRREFEHLFDLPTEELCADEEKLILWELGSQWGKNIEQLKADNTVHPFIIRNSLITLLSSYSSSSFEVVFEILRQSEDIINFNLPDYKGFTYILPMLSMIFEYQPELFEQFLLEEGLTDYSKRIVAELLARMGSENETNNDSYNKRIHEELVDIFSMVLDTYIADYPIGKICDQYVISHVVKAVVNAGLMELSEQLKSVYSKDMVDKRICGELDINLSVTKDLGATDLNYIETGTYPLMFLPLYLLWDNPDNTDFGEQEIYKAHE